MPATGSYAPGQQASIHITHQRTKGYTTPAVWALEAHLRRFSRRRCRHERGQVWPAAGAARRCPTVRRRRVACLSACLRAGRGHAARSGGAGGGGGARAPQLLYRTHGMHALRIHAGRRMLAGLRPYTPHSAGSPRSGTQQEGFCTRTMRMRGGLQDGCPCPPPFAPGPHTSGAAHKRHTQHFAMSSTGRTQKHTANPRAKLANPSKTL